MMNNVKYELDNQTMLFCEVMNVLREYKKDNNFTVFHLELQTYDEEELAYTRDSKVDFNCTAIIYNTLILEDLVNIEATTTLHNIHVIITDKNCIEIYADVHCRMIAL